MAQRSFEHYLKTKVVFGSGSLSRTAAEVSYYNPGGVLVVTDRGVCRAGLLDRLLTALSEQGLRHAVYDEVTPNPATDVVQAVADYRSTQNCDVIVAIGGGSSIDTAKGAAILATSGGKIEDFAGAGRVAIAPAPVVAIPTTAGTGAEVSTSLAVTNASDHSKFAVRSPLVSPDVAIGDPDLLATLPKRAAIDTGMDTFCHLLEGYVSKGATPLTDALAMDGIERCGKWLPAFVADRANEEAAHNMLYAAMLGGIVSSQARTGAVHTLTRPMGDQVTHGLANAVLLPYVLEFNLMAAAEKFIKIAQALGRPVAGRDLSAAHEAVDAVREICTRLDIPERLRDVGIPGDQIDSLASKAHKLEISGLNPRELAEQDIRNLLQEAY